MSDHICPPEHKHGASTTCKVNHKCTCEPCGVAIRARQSAWRRNRAYGRVGEGDMVDARGTRRRLQALAARGWSLAALGRELSMSGQAVHQAMNRTQVRKRSADSIAALYSRLWNVQPPRATTADRIAYSIAINHAARNGYVPPLGWDDIDLDPEPPSTEDVIDDGFDHAAVELAVTGHNVALTKRERVEATRQLHGKRWSDSRIAARLRISSKAILVYRRELGLPAIVDPVPEWGEAA